MALSKMDFSVTNITLFVNQLIEVVKKPENVIFFEAAKIYLQAA